MWIFEFYNAFIEKGVMPIYDDDIDYSNASCMKWTWYVECIKMNACDIMNAR